MGAIYKVTDDGEGDLMLQPIVVNQTETNWERGNGTISATDWIDTSEGFSCPFYVNRALGLCQATLTMKLKSGVTYTGLKELVTGLPKAKSLYTSCSIISVSSTQCMIDFTTSGTIRTGNIWSGSASVGGGWMVVSATYVIDDSERY